MLKTISIAAALLTVAIQAFSPGIYFPEVDDNDVYLNYWDPYSGSSVQYQVTSNAYVLLKCSKSS